MSDLVAEESLVDVVADLPADAQPLEPVQQRDRLLHHPAVHAQARAMLGAAAGDIRGNASAPDLPRSVVDRFCGAPVARITVIR